MSEKYYVVGCVDNGLDVDQVEDQDAEFWTLYARDVNGESEALADFADRRSAEAAMAVYVERDVLGEQVRALAADNAAMMAAINPDVLSEEIIDAVNKTANFDWDCNESGSWTWVENDAEVARAVLESISIPQTLTTDAILNEVRAQAVEDFAEVNKAEWLPAYIEALVQHATRIRAGEVPNV